MSKFLSAICFAAAMLAVSSNVFGQAKKEMNTVLFQPGMPLDDCDNMPNGKMRYSAGYIAPASIELDQAWDMYASAAFTYWYASQDAMDIGYVTPHGAVTPALSTPGTVIYQKFGYAPGFQVGLGFDTNFDDWTVDAEYTWYNKTQSGSASVPGEYIHANDWFTVDPLPAGDQCDLFCRSENSAATVSSKWKLKLNMVDLVLGRPFYEGKRVTLSPVCGLRGLWIKQNMNIALIDLFGLARSGASVAVSSSSWAVGPTASVNSKWMVWKGLRVDAVMGSSLLYTRYTSIKDTQTSTSTAGVVSAVTSSVHNVSAVRPTVNMGLGLGYGGYCCSNRFFVDFSARYDFMQFWSQNVMHNFTSELSGRDDVIGDLRLHGLTATLRFDF